MFYIYIEIFIQVLWYISKYKTISHSLLSRSGYALIQSFLEQKCCLEALLLRTLKSPFMEVHSIYRGSRSQVNGFYFPPMHTFIPAIYLSKFHTHRAHCSTQLLADSYCKSRTIQAGCKSKQKIFMKYLFLSQPSRQVACSFWAVCPTEKWNKHVQASLTQAWEASMGDRIVLI